MLRRIGRSAKGLLLFLLLAPGVISRHIIRAVSIADLLILAGLAGVFYGLHHEWPWLAYAGTGAIFLLLGVVAANREAAREVARRKEGR
ncbi:MAG: hypothetical protein Q8R92_16350 [Deltaproteobacteria bacterium]|nr:hypothetical protein [Deltaproteobacteria bacterium]